jgi:cytochrome c-type biogenesis protein CcmH
MKVLLLMVLFFSGAAEAAIDAYPFPNNELRDRHQALIDELRCPQCLNTNLAGSDSMIAKDLRREVHRLLLEGKSDEEILDFMYQRYGDFILYKPRLKSGTLVLWFGPLILLLIALFVMIRILVTRKGNHVAMDDADVDRLKELTGKN